MIAQGQDPAAGTPHLVQAQIVLAHDIVGIDQVLALLLADDLSHDEDHALQINQWTLIDMSQLPAIAVDLLVAERALLNERGTGKGTARVSKTGTESLVVTGTSLGLPRETESQKRINQAIGIVTETKRPSKAMIKMMLEIMIKPAIMTVTG